MPLSPSASFLLAQGQEPDAAPQVCQFAKDRFKATFPIMDKVDVNGNNAAPVFNFLKEQQPGFLTNAVKCKWGIEEGREESKEGKFSERTGYVYASSDDVIGFSLGKRREASSSSVFMPSWCPDVNPIWTCLASVGITG